MGVSGASRSPLSDIQYVYPLIHNKVTFYVLGVVEQRHDEARPPPGGVHPPL